MTTEDLLHIPDFLNRKLWTPERWEQHEESWRALDRERQRERDRVAAKRRRAFDKQKAEAAGLAERRAAREQSKARSTAKKAAVAQVRGAIHDGHVTFGQLRKALSIEDNLIKIALRRLMQAGEIHKASPRQYAAN